MLQKSFRLRKYIILSPLSLTPTPTHTHTHAHTHTHTNKQTTFSGENTGIRKWTKPNSKKICTIVRIQEWMDTGNEVCMHTHRTASVLVHRQQDEHVQPFTVQYHLQRRQNRTVVTASQTYCYVLPSTTTATCLDHLSTSQQLVVTLPPLWQKEIPPKTNQHHLKHLLET